MDPGIVDVVGVVLVRRHRVGAEQLVRHHLGKAENGVERGAQFVAHLRQEPRFRDVGGFRTAARFVGLRLGLLELADQCVLLGARLQHGEVRSIESVGEQSEITQRRYGEAGQHVAVYRAEQHVVYRNRDRKRRRGGEHCNRQARAQRAGDRDDEQHDEHVDDFGRPRIFGRADEVDHPGQTEQQIEHDESESRLFDRHFVLRPGKERATFDHACELNCEHHGDPQERPGKARPEGRNGADDAGEQDDSKRTRQTILGVLAQQLVVEGRSRAGGRGQAVARVADTLRCDSPVPRCRRLRPGRHGEGIGTRGTHRSADVVKKVLSVAQKP